MERSSSSSDIAANASKSNSGHPTYIDVSIEYVIQNKQFGSGHALLQTTDTVNESHIVVNGDRLVAATKTFATQLASLTLLQVAIGGSSETRQVVSALRELPADVQSLLDDSAAREVAETYADANAFFFIGRGYHYPVALEGALKMKEITYRHAEGFAAGELKHGPLALVTEHTPVFAVVTGADQLSTKTVGNVKEVEARNAPVVAVTDGRSEVERYADRVLTVPEIHPSVASVLANVQLQLVSYHVARELGRPIDKPRNLAKSVTVE